MGNLKEISEIIAILVACYLSYKLGKYSKETIKINNGRKAK